ncbi:hypothetical protein C8Q78DRAFT_1083726 [Trametes maxima]|nr:hypothetical protein C8Q78DRAFT_1083726 [Trametes maxima]
MATNGPALSGFAALMRVHRGGRAKKTPAGRGRSQTQQAPPSLAPPPPSPPSSLPPRSFSPAVTDTTPDHTASAHATPASSKESSDGDTPSEDHHQDKRLWTTIPYNQNVIRNFERVIKLNKQSNRIAEGVEYLYEAAQMLPWLIGTFVQYDCVLIDALVSDGEDDDNDDNYSQDMEWNTHWQVQYNFAFIKERVYGDVSNDTSTSSEPSAYELYMQEIAVEKRDCAAAMGTVNVESENSV